MAENKSNLYVEYSFKNASTYFVPLESLVTLFMCKFIDDINFNIILVNENKPKQASFSVDLSGLHCLDLKNETPKSLCSLPYIVIDSNIIISGLCAVNRQILKLSTDDDTKLLGFKSACLKAPNEVSIWTKFCEIDMINTVKRAFVINLPQSFPIDLVRFENHMSQPVRMHNIYKQGQIHGKNELIQTIPKEQLNIPHLYVEGPFMTVADIILIPQLYLLFQKYSTEHFPLANTWYKQMLNHAKVANAFKFIKQRSNILNGSNLIIPEVKNESLYKADPKRYRPQSRIYTKQDDIELALSKICKLSKNRAITPPNKPYGIELDVDWNKISLDEALPTSRVQRKYDQLKNLSKAVVKIARVNDIIVDFCSGCGHLGIILAQLLPSCSIILLENKEESLNRARNRVKSLNLSNVKLVQCNLDYFTGHFNIGLSLHACGVATDLVMQQCISKNAHFVCCPCCYGGVHNCHHLTYPRSLFFQKSDLTLRDYLVLGHAADQTHDSANVKTIQGELCMNVIDNDRIFYAEEMGYKVFFGKLEPKSCTPKNNLLVGLRGSIE